MKKSIMVIGIIALTFIMVSNATAVPYHNSKPIIEKVEEIENKISFLNEKLGKTGFFDILKNIRNNKIDDLTSLKSIIKDIHQTFKTDIFSIIGVLLGIIFTIAGFGFLGATIVFIIMGWIALMFNPMGFIFIPFALVAGIISLIFLGGGFSLLFINSPLLAIPIIVSLFIVFIVILMSIFG